ncbi:MAG: 16S rRNA (cytosine(967)-C(5))-methyltransferase RsmB [Clostridia bacterium]|nr:16S rRNA (cytosine(967)-C(5))-methyltransferase RsmB [Clostridia bacterium]
MATAREIALKILYETEAKDAYLNIVFAKTMRSSSLPPIERALVKELTVGVMKHKITLDYAIAKFSSVRLKKISPYILNILRLGIYQLHFMDKIPASAAVNESVKLAKKYGHRASAGFVNALLKRIAAESLLPIPKRSASEAAYLSIKYSHPEELCQWYMDTFGDERAEELIAKNNEKPPICARVNCLKTNREELIERLKDEGISAEASQLTDCGILIREGNIEATESYKKGYLSVQGVSSQLAALVLLPKAGETVLDLCAAPGGKTAHLAELMGNEGRIFAADLYEHRLCALRENAERLGISIISAAQGDATVEKSEWLEQADKILLDVPCSGLGIIRRKPDIRYKAGLVDFDEIIRIQKNILNICSKYLKIEGELVYSTCTINPQENMGVVEEFLKEHPDFALVPMGNEHINSALCEEMEKGYITLYPEAETDGFFICKMKRRG